MSAAPESAKVFVFRLCEIYDEHGTTPVLGVDKMIAQVEARDAAVRRAALEEAADAEAGRFVTYLERADEYTDTTDPSYHLAMRAAGEIEGVVRRLRATSRSPCAALT